MARYKRLSFLCNAQERELIAQPTTALRRSQSDTVRFVVVSVAHQLERLSPSWKTEQPFHMNHQIIINKGD